MGLIQTIREEWAVVRKAPFITISSVAILAGAIGAAMYFLFQVNLSRKNDLIGTLTSQVTALTNKTEDLTRQLQAKRQEARAPVTAAPIFTPKPTPTYKTPPASSQPKVQNTAAGGIANSGTINGGAQVFNGPPPPHLEFVEEVTKSYDGLEKLFTVRVRTDRSISGARIALVCSGPVELVDINRVGLDGAGAHQIDSLLLRRDGVVDPNEIGIAINIPASFSPNQTLIVPLRAKSNVRVESVVTLTN